MLASSNIRCRLRHLSSMVRILNVAEKNDAAKSIATVMSRGGFRKREGFSRFNKIYEYEYNVQNQNCTMTMTSVSGHLLGMDFVGQYRKWYSCSPVSLFDVPVEKFCPDNFTDIKRTLEREIRGCQKLIIWTDGDREGENIGFEIIQVCKALKPNIPVLRARFSEITPRAIETAVNHLVQPDKNTSDAVDVRSELDLRIGAAFTRFQTLRLQKVFPAQLAEQLISYGSCQFPTLGFVVERYKQVQAFIPEPFWKLKVTHTLDEVNADFTWKRNRLFNHLACLVLYENCIENPQAIVIDVKSKPKSKWRPQALETVELEKLGSRKLKINAKETMKIAEKLYTGGFISYPRTETNMFPKDFDLNGLINEQTRDPNWGGFAQGILESGGSHPRNGNKTDNAHPPIHPIKYTATLQGNEQKIYEFIVRHFLACCSKDAQGHETIVEIDVAGEQFVATGLMILAKNYLEVYHYEKWNAKEIPLYEKGDSFEPDLIEMCCGETGPPPLLSEADLIALMDKHGIGTDATHADHIETIKNRLYVGVRPDGRFVPGQLGMGLVEGYDSMGYAMSKPNLRAELEAGLKDICDGRKNRDDVLSLQIQKYKEVFIEACNQALKLDEALSHYLGEAQTVTVAEVMNTSVATPVRPCPQCGQDMVLKEKKDNKGFYLGCMGYPSCRGALWFPEFVLEAMVEDSVCNQCGSGNVHLLKFKFKRGSVPPVLMSESMEYTGCISCDSLLQETMSISPDQFKKAHTATQQTQGRTIHRGTSHTQGQNSSNNQRSAQRTFAGTDNSGLTVAQPRNEPRPQPLRNQQNTGPVDNGDNNIVCLCGNDATLLTVRKEGPNTGRQFYKCNKPSGTGCNFFLWADENPSDAGAVRGNQHSNSENTYNRIQPSSQTRQNNRDSFIGGDAQDVQCNCGQAAKSLTVQKEGPNKGRKFHACPKPKGEGCNFFQWDDHNADEASTSRPSSSRQGNAVPKTRLTTRSDSGEAKKRKCGICGVEGHSRRTCPHK